MSAPATTKVKITGIDIHAYLVKDARRAIAFYRDVLGLTPEEESDQGAEFILPDGSTFGVWDPQGTMPWVAGNGIMFAVEDLAATLEIVKSHGAKFGEIMDTPVCLMSVGEDTEGNQVILHKRKI